jgi:hypothetical protein
MANVSDFLEFILPEIPSTKAMALSKIKQTCSDFCGRANVWRYKPGMIRTRDGVADYLIPRRSGTTVVKVLRLNDVEAGIEYKVAASPDQANGFSFIHPDPHEIVLLPTPQESRLLSIEVSLKPILTANEVDDVLMDRWADAIIAGTLYRLKSMPGKTWSDIQTAKAVHYVDYEKQIRRALDIDLRGHSGGSIEIQPSGGYF